MAVEYIKIKSGLYGTSLYGDGGSLQNPASGTPAYPSSPKVGEPLWARDVRTLYIRDGNGRLKSPLPDITQSHDAASEIPVIAASAVPTYQILVQDPNSLTKKRIAISSLGTGGLTSDSQVAINSAGATAGKNYYLNTALLTDTARGIVKTTAGDDTSMTISASIGATGQLGVVKGGNNISIDSNGVLSVAIASNSGAGIASFPSADFTVSGAGAVSITAGKYVVLTPGGSATQTVAGKIIATAPSSAYNTDGSVLVTKDFMLNTVASWGNKFDFKEAVVACLTNATQIGLIVNGSSIDTVAITTGARVLLADPDVSDWSANGIYVAQASGAAVRAADFDVNAGDAATLLGSVIPVVGGGANRGLWMTMSIAAGAVSIMPTSNDMNITSPDSSITIEGSTGIDQTMQLYIKKGNSVELSAAGGSNTGLNVKIKSGSTGLAIDSGGIYLSVIDGGEW